MTLTRNEMYQAILSRDTTFEGIFYTAVKTTGIFCRPSCTARKPKIENVEFLKTTREALAKGYRPCKICRPLQLPEHTPEKIEEVLGELRSCPGLRLRDRDLVARGLEPHTVRRWFLRNHGITFHAYQRMLRLNTAFKKIHDGQSVTAAAFDAGYNSLSGFSDSYKSVFGKAPSGGRTAGIIDLKRIETPLGTMFACAVREGICLLEFTERRMLETEFEDLTKKLNATIVQGENPHFTILESQLQEYFDGRRKEFSVPLHPVGTPFQQEVWKELQSIPYGQTRTYKEQALALGRPGAVRAVANANGMNKIALIIPCHRVIGSDGSLTGYAGGLPRKRALLDLESRNSNRPYQHSIFQ